MDIVKPLKMAFIGFSFLVRFRSLIGLVALCRGAPEDDFWERDLIGPILMELPAKWTDAG
jgi:hypothetical protein